MKTACYREDVVETIQHVRVESCGIPPQHQKVSWHSWYNDTSRGGLEISFCRDCRDCLGHDKMTIKKVHT